MLAPFFKLVQMGKKQLQLPIIIQIFMHNKKAFSFISCWKGEKNK